MKRLNYAEIIHHITMTSAERIDGLYKALESIHQNKIAGDIVECGVWRGGNIIIAKTALDSVNSKRIYWAYDTFEGMTQPTKNDPPEAHSIWQLPGYGACLSPLDEVIANFKQWGVWDDCIRIVKGDINQTLLDKNNLPGQISILRLDTDWYESTLLELEILYPRLVPGGYIIIDDYGHWSGCRQAVHEYFGQSFTENNFIKLDYTGIMYKKS
jgi:hypothetical protein